MLDTLTAPRDEDDLNTVRGMSGRIPAGSCRKHGPAHARLPAT